MHGIRVIEFVGNSPFPSGGSTSPTPLVVTVPPTMSGEFSERGEITIDPGVWEGSPSSFAYQLFVDDVAIQGATAQQQTIPPNTAGKLLTARVTAFRDSESVQAWTAASPPIAPWRLPYKPVVIFMGDSQAGGTADNQSADGYVPSDKVKIAQALNGQFTGWTDYNPGVAGASGMNSGTSASWTGIGPELEFARQFRAEHPDETLYIYKDARSGAYQSRGPSIGTVTGSMAGNVIAQTATSGTATGGNQVLVAATGPQPIYIGFNGGGSNWYVYRVGSSSTSDLSGTSVPGGTVWTKYDGTASYSPSEGLIYNGNSGAINNGMKARMSAALASLTTPKIIALGLILGTNDKGAAPTANTFQADTVAFVTKLRTDFALMANVPTIQARVNNSGTGGATVRSAQAALVSADALFKVVDMDAQPLSGDGTHWRQAALNHLGAGIFAQAVF